VGDFASFAKIFANFYFGRAIGILNDFCCNRNLKKSHFVDLSDGRTISVPLAWYPRLLHGSVEERNDYRFIAGSSGIHWNQLESIR